ncbi:sulfurtransferase [Candidatus Contendibacter odensensis]|uniref:3-mercaptopyruvate sulfurtransferase n=1 Tax=Candidatus Contendobacter odensis Run_B_J11 TaxID=1400861 RepID=A0A7U7GD12_9GAMM|nr:sulfurtransferase [Candidatus Contendobacter odensis]MBK8751155.1 sulfurtransferase [Candidatus Competibacteraceae bacterium]CDH46037.1 putative 3-mercaptopyruvate sulfurtransferase [Candidatus Contendobacter odensis Run_B_J11]
MNYDTLIDATTLNAHCCDPDWVVVDCRFTMADIEAGERAYRESHIPGARYAHLDADLSSPITPVTGRHPLPDPTRLAHTLGKWGIGPDTQVVAYDDMGGMLAAARLWWLLRWVRHRAGAVLDGGFPAWQRACLPLTAELPIVRPVIFDAKPDHQHWLTTAQVLALPADEVLLDARGAARYQGEMEPIDPVAGHIPGAINLPTDGNLTPDGHFLPPVELRARFATALGRRLPDAVVHSCGSGVSACHNLLAMETAGLNGSRLYAGSWSEWIRDPARPVATGAD